MSLPAHQQPQSSESATLTPAAYSWGRSEVQWRMALLRMLDSRTLGRLVAEIRPVDTTWARISVYLIGFVLREKERQC